MNINIEYALPYISKLFENFWKLLHVRSTQGSTMRGGGIYRKCSRMVPSCYLRLPWVLWWIIIMSLGCSKPRWKQRYWCVPHGVRKTSGYQPITAQFWWTYPSPFFFSQILDYHINLLMQTLGIKIGTYWPLLHVPKITFANFEKEKGNEFFTKKKPEFSWLSGEKKMTASSFSEPWFQVTVNME